MSEYLIKKAVLEWLESEMSINKGHPDDIDIHWTLNRVSKKNPIRRIRCRHQRNPAS